MRSLENINKELRTLVTFQALSELRSKLSQDETTPFVGSYQWRAVEERIDGLAREEESAVRSIKGLMGIERRLETISDALLAVISGLETGAISTGDISEKLSPVVSSLDTLSSTRDEYGAESRSDQYPLSDIAQWLSRIGAGAVESTNQAVIASLDEQLNRILKLTEMVSESISRLEASRAHSEVQAANLNAMTIDSDSMVKAARELGMAQEKESPRRVRKVS
ncbi:hypothetical protein ACFLT7_05690 [candidate division KSB1 bacterium]